VDAEHPFALDYQTIATAQDQDPELQHKLATKPNTPWRICLPTVMLHGTVRWYHLSLNLIGPWKIRVNGRRLKFRALTIIDTVTNYCEIIRIHNKKSAHVALQFENAWISRYPQPIACIFDQGRDFTGQPFTDALLRHNIHPSPTTVKNPQANAICERLHQTVSNALRPLLHTHHPNNEDEASLIMDTALQTAAYSAGAAIHGSLKITPGALVFHRDMILNIPIIADLELLRQRRQALIDEQLIRANRRRLSHDYQRNDEVQILTYKPGKLDPRASTPFRIIRIHTNGTVTIQRTPLVTERINIRWLRSYRR
jgi:hypothetical protein